MSAREYGELKSKVSECIDSHSSDLLELSHRIHAKPELAFNEVEASGNIAAFLAEHGLSVQRAVYGLDTALEAEFGDGGPTVALCAEYDALPGIGHACGHNLIATASVGATLALFSFRDELPGCVRFLGTPAEEDGGGKELMLRAGAFEGVDAAMVVHPAGVNLESMPCIARTGVKATYHGRTAHASASPELGINALDALVVAYQSIGALRQHIGSDERIHGIITDGGQAANVVPERAAGHFYVRAGDARKLGALKERVSGCFEAGAKATGARLELAWDDVDYLDLKRNPPLEEAFRQNAERLGREFIPMELLPPGIAGSTDMGNVSYAVPSIHPMIAAAPIDVTIHNPKFTEYAKDAGGDAAAIDGAKALAMTTLDYLFDEELRDESRRAFELALASL